MNTKDETQEINLEPPCCTRCGEKIRGVWAIERSKIERRHLCGLCRDDEINNRGEITRAKLNKAADKLMKQWGER